MEESLNNLTVQSEGLLSSGNGIIYVMVGLVLLIIFNWKINGFSGIKKRKKKVDESEDIHGTIIEKISKTQKEMKNDIENDNEIIEEKKEAINEIIEEHNNEIVEVLTSNDVKSTLKRIKEKWQSKL